MEKNSLIKNGKKGIIPTIGACLGTGLSNWTFAVKVAAVFGVPQAALIPISVYATSVGYDFIKRKYWKKYFGTK